jgi:DUF1009 family protein
MAGSPLGIVAGGGALPLQLAEHAHAAGRGVFILGVAGFADPALVQRFGGVSLSIGETGKQITALKHAGCEDLVFAGVVKRPDLASLKFDARGAMLLPKLVAAAMKGDDALMRTVVEAFEEAGFRVIGADDVLGRLLALPGPLGRLAPGVDNWRDIRRAAEAAAAIGALDIGQGAVSCDGLVLAVEAQEGTDQMLRRVAGLPQEIRGHATARRGVLVKRPKPQQERRIDLPTIGLTTVQAAADAGLAGIAIAAGATLVLDSSDVAQKADELGLFVYGFADGELA